MPLLLKRDRSNGVIFNAYNNTRTPMVLRGGHYHLFGNDGGLRYWAEQTPTGLQAFRVCFPTSEPSNPDGCTRDHRSPKLYEVDWTTNRLAMLNTLVANGGNFLRVFLSDGVFLSGSTITSLHPYERLNGKWRIAAASGGNQSAWSAAYFTRLRDFVVEADDRGVVVQLCLFSHHDLRSDLDNAGHRYWSMSFWNPANADDPTNLVTIDTTYLDVAPEPPDVPPTDREELREEGRKSALRNQDFMNTARTGLMGGQRAFVIKVLETVCPLGNVILELNNEPRLLNDTRNPALPTPGEYQARWLDTAAGWILAWLAAQPVGWRPLISANATPPRPQGEVHDVDTWALRPAPTCYPELDAVSYHGLTGYGSVTDTSEKHCDTTTLPAVDRASIQRRVTEHRSKHNSKSLIFSTDAVRHFPQNYPADGGGTAELQRREGQVCTSLDYEEQATPPTERAQADLDNWAYVVLRHGFDRFGDGTRAGSVHFQNHSTTEPSFQAVGSAVAAAQGTAAPARNTGRWGPRFARTTGGSGNFWWAHRFNPGAGEIVNQLGTRDAPEAVGAQGSSAIGWRYDITPATSSRFGFEADYEVVSVSDREQGARVTPMVAVTLFAVGPAGGLGAQLGRAERVLAPGAGPGTLVLMADLAAGGRYAAVLTGEVAISYTNRYQGYGETILRFPEMRLCGVP